MYVPIFPYTGSQAIISSERVTLLGDKDSVFIFGNQAVSLSSQYTVNIDANEKFIVSSPKTLLGSKNADQKEFGEPELLGDTLVNELLLLIDDLTEFFNTAKDVKYSDLDTIRSKISAPASKISKSLPRIRNVIQNSTRSQKVYIQKNS
jgi:ElaB/YqjD/DUF883 family membrane-anchored ribosome-binding protein